MSACQQSVDGDGCDESPSDFVCVDPNAPCVEDDDITVDMLENCGSVEDIGDGYCSNDLNTEECGKPSPRHNSDSLPLRDTVASRSRSGFNAASGIKGNTLRP